MNVEASLKSRSRPMPYSSSGVLLTQRKVFFNRLNLYYAVSLGFFKYAVQVVPLTHRRIQGKETRFSADWQVLFECHFLDRASLHTPGNE